MLDIRAKADQVVQALMAGYQPADADSFSHEEKLAVVERKIDYEIEGQYRLLSQLVKSTGHEPTEVRLYSEWYHNYLAWTKSEGREQGHPYQKAKDLMQQHSRWFLSQATIRNHATATAQNESPDLEVNGLILKSKELQLQVLEQWTAIWRSRCTDAGPATPEDSPSLTEKAEAFATPLDPDEETSRDLLKRIKRARPAAPDTSAVTPGVDILKYRSEAIDRIGRNALKRLAPSSEFIRLAHRKRGTRQPIFFIQAPSRDTPLPEGLSRNEVLDGYPEHLTNVEVMVQFVSLPGTRLGSYETKDMATRLSPHATAVDGDNLTPEVRVFAIHAWITREKKYCNQYWNLQRKRAAQALADEVTSLSEYDATPCPTGLIQGQGASGYIIPAASKSKRGLGAGRIVKPRLIQPKSGPGATDGMAADSSLQDTQQVQLPSFSDLLMSIRDYQTGKQREGADQHDHSAEPPTTQDAGIEAGPVNYLDQTPSFEHGPQEWTANEEAVPAWAEEIKKFLRSSELTKTPEDQMPVGAGEPDPATTNAAAEEEHPVLQPLPEPNPKVKLEGSAPAPAPAPDAEYFETAYTNALPAMAEFPWANDTAEVPDLSPEFFAQWPVDSPSPPNDRQDPNIPDIADDQVPDKEQESQWRQGRKGELK